MVNRSRSDALFLRDGETFVPTDATQGPWGSGLLHGGAVAALFAEVLEERSDPSLVSIRLTVDLIRPVPQQPLVLATSVVRSGRRLHVLEGELRAAGTLVARCSLLRLRPVELSLPEQAVTVSSSPLDSPERFFPFSPPPSGRDRPGFLGGGIELRVSDPAVGLRAGIGWFRLRLSVLPARDPSPMARVAAAADFGNGISAPVPSQAWTSMRFLNADLDVHLSRLPEAEWIRISSSSTWTGAGIGLTHTDLADTRGPIGVAQQALALERVELPEPDVGTGDARAQGGHRASLLGPPQDPEGFQYTDEENGV